MIARLLALLLCLLAGIVEAAAPTYRFYGSSGSVTRTITFFNFSASGANSVTLPSSLQTSDLGILSDCANNKDSTIPASVYPSGWTSFGTSVTSSSGTQRLRYNLSYRVLSSSDSSTSVVGMSGSNSNGKILSVFRKNTGTWGTPTGLVQAASAAFGGFGAQALSASGGTAPLFTIGFENLNDAGHITQNVTNVSHFSGSQSLSYSIYAASPLNSNFSAVSDDGGCISAMWVQLGP